VYFSFLLLCFLVFVLPSGVIKNDDSVYYKQIVWMNWNGGSNGLIDVLCGLEQSIFWRDYWERHQACVCAKGGHL